MPTGLLQLQGVDRRQDVGPESDPVEIEVRRHPGLPVSAEIGRQDSGIGPRGSVRAEQRPDRGSPWRARGAPAGPSPPRSCSARVSPSGVVARVGSIARARYRHDLWQWSRRGSPQR